MPVNRYDDPRWYEEKYPEYDGPVTHSMQSQSSEPVDNDFPLHFLLPISQDHASEQDTEGQLPILHRHSRLQRVFEQFLIIVPFVIIAFWGGWFGHEFFTNSWPNQSNRSKADAYLIQDAWNKIDQNYVDRKDMDYKKMAYAAINAMAQSLGDTGHSRFMSPQDVKNENQLLNGKYTGIGVYLYQDPYTHILSINATIPHSPAEKAGLKHGDILVAINGVSMQGKNIVNASNLIDGKINTSVTITIQRPGEVHSRDIKIIRTQIQVSNVIMHYIPESHIAHIQIIQFASGVSNQLRYVLNQAKTKGATKIILDLRNNPGGYLQEAIDTTSLFVKNGNVLLEEDRNGKRKPIPVNGNPVDTSSQIIVLMNRNSASAAEIVAGALKDDHRVILLGQKTYGTGTVLQQFMLSDGSALYLGTQEWLTPDGNFIRQNPHKPGSGGINPDISVPLPVNIPILTPNDENQRHLTEQQILACGDTQLSAAIDYLSK
jgi:carboxyl-terminal processing protease